MAIPLQVFASDGLNLEKDIVYCTDWVSRVNRLNAKGYLDDLEGRILLNFKERYDQSLKDLNSLGYYDDLNVELLKVYLSEIKYIFEVNDKEKLDFLTNEELLSCKRIERLATEH